jgi:hypothetical protein
MLALQGRISFLTQYRRYSHKKKDLIYAHVTLPTAHRNTSANSSTRRTIHELLREPSEGLPQSLLALRMSDSDSESPKTPNVQYAVAS